jgi:hypothetical protein
MGFKDLLAKLMNKDQEMKEEEHRRKIQRILDTRELSSNERELMKFQDEEREEQIKEALEIYRKRKQEDITFNHNALDTPTIMKSKWEVLKEKNIFANNKNTVLNSHSTIKSKNIFMRR